IQDQCVTMEVSLGQCQGGNPDSKGRVLVLTATQYYEFQNWAMVQLVVSLVILAGGAALFYVLSNRQKRRHQAENEALIKQFKF
ncbi:hypothetical protein KIPB_011787, partial [Kipferlia bialata]